MGKVDFADGQQPHEYPANSLTAFTGGEKESFMAYLERGNRLYDANPTT